METILVDSQNYVLLSKILERKFIVKDYNKSRSGLLCFFGSGPTSRAKNICKNNKNYNYLDLDFAANLLGLDIDLNRPLIEIYKQVNILQLINKALQTQGYIHDYKDDIFSMSIPNFYRLDFENYLGEDTNNIDLIKTCIKKEKRLIIEASAGTGKTALIDKYLEVCNELTPRAKRLIFVVPTLPIAEQTEQDIVKKVQEAATRKNLSWTLVCTAKDKTHAKEQDHLHSSKVLICVYDSLYKVASQGLIEDSVLVLDEYHMLVTEQGYRKAFEYRKILEAQRLVFLSATPNYFFTLDHKLLNFKLLKCFTKASNKIEIFPILHNASQLQLFPFIKDLIKKYDLGKGKKILIKKDSKKWIESSVKNATDEGLICEAFYSGNKQRKEENKNYLQALETGLIDNEINFLFVTRLLEAGFSLKQAFDVVLTDIKHWSNIVQTVIRPRYNHKTNINKNTKVILLQKEKKDSVYYPKFSNAKQYILDCINLTQQEVNKLNSICFSGQALEQEQDLESDVFTKFVKLDEVKDIYHIDILKILFDVHNEDTKTSGLDLNLKRVSRCDKRIHIHELRKEIGSGLICSHLQEEKEQAKHLNKQAEQEAVKDLKLFCTAMLRSGKNIKLKRDIHSQDQAYYNSLEVDQARDDYQELFKTYKAKQILKNWLFWKDRTTQEDIVHFCTLDKKSGKIEQDKRILLERAKEARKARKGQAANISKHKNYENDLYLELRTTIRERNKQQRKNKKDGFLSLSKIVKITRKDLVKVKQNLGLETCDFDRFTDRKILQYIKAVFSVESKTQGRGKDRKTVYYLHLK